MDIKKLYIALSLEERQEFQQMFLERNLLDRKRIEKRWEDIYRMFIEDTLDKNHITIRDWIIIYEDKLSASLFEVLKDGVYFIFHKKFNVGKISVSGFKLVELTRAVFLALEGGGKARWQEFEDLRKEYMSGAWDNPYRVPRTQVKEGERYVPTSSIWEVEMLKNSKSFK